LAGATHVIAAVFTATVPPTFTLGAAGVAGTVPTAATAVADGVAVAPGDSKLVPFAFLAVTLNV
jgi:hypothetical protein